MKTNLRKWTRSNLSKEDYSFAGSNMFNPRRRSRQRQRHKWPAGIIEDCLKWEAAREFETAGKDPYVIALRDRIDNPLPPNPPELLTEVNDIETAIKDISEQPGHPFCTYHVFKIEDHSNTDSLVQSFRNWLTRKAANGGSRFTLCNGDSLFVLRRKAGRRPDYARLLRALALRRLKQAGYSRTEAADKVFGKTGDNAKNESRISSSDWNRLPIEAERFIKKNAGDGKAPVERLTLRVAEKFLA